MGSERSEVKHLSSSRKRYSESSGERNRTSLNLMHAKLKGVVRWVLWEEFVGSLNFQVELQNRRLEERHGKAGHRG